MEREHGLNPEIRRRMIQESGLTVEAVYPGSWTGERDGALDFQDVVVLRK